MNRSQLTIVAVGSAALLGAAALMANMNRVAPPTGARAAGFKRVMALVELPEGDILALPSGSARSIPVTVFYPAQGPRGAVLEGAPTDGPLAPLLVWSHTDGLDPAAHTGLATELASRGYVVALPEHSGMSGSSAGHWPRWEQADVGLHDPLVSAARQVFRDAAPILLADQAAAIEAAMSAVVGVQTDRIFYGGHGVGGGLAVHGCLKDERCAGVITVDGPPVFEQVGTGTQGRAVLMPPALGVPLLAVVSEGAAGSVAALPAFTAEAAMRQRATAEVWAVSVTGAGHLDLTDVGLQRGGAFAANQWAADGNWGDAGPAGSGEALRSVVSVFSERFARRNPGVDLGDTVGAYPVLQVR